MLPNFIKWLSSSFAGSVVKLPLMGKKALERSVERTLEKAKIETYIDYGKIERITSPLPDNIEIIDKYQTGYNHMATITIYRDLDTDVYVYHIEEPPISPIVENLYKLVRERFQSMEMELPEKITERELVYEKYIQEALKELGYEDAYTKYPELRYYLIRDIAGWRVIDVPMRDPRVEELDYSSTNSTLSVVVKHDKIAATWVDTNINLSEEDLLKLIEFIAFKTGKQISVAQPILEARTPEGYRLAANLKEVGMSPAFTIRKFPEMPLSLTFLVKNKTMSPLIAAYLWTLVEHLRFILVIGGMATGKTTILQAITSVIPRDRKVVCVAPGTRVATNAPRAVDILFVGNPVVKENIETIDSDVPVLGFKDGKVFWTKAEKVHKIHIPKDIKLVKLITEFGAEVTVTPNTKIPVLTENGIVYKPASEVRVGDLVPQLAYYEPMKIVNPEHSIEYAKELGRKGAFEEWLYTAPLNYVVEYLKSLVENYGERKENALVIHVERDIGIKVVELLLRIGVVGILSPSSVIVKDRFVSRLLEALEKGVPSNNVERVIWIRVKNVDYVEHNGIVYDITPRDAQYFFAGNGGFIVVEDTIEDTPELRLAHPRWQALYTRRSVYGTEQDVTLFDLARYSLRTRAQYIIIGEVRDREIQTLVQMAASGHGSLCTFHAEDPETLFLRMTSPPLNVQPSFLLTIAAIVLQQRVWSRRYGKFIRRTGKIWEVTGIKQTVREGEIPVAYKEVFSWDPVDDYHYPDDPEDLVRESRQIQIIARSTYGEDQWFDQIVWELEEKKKYIEQLVDEGVFDFREVTERIYRKSLELRKKEKSK
jgi:type IV secretory pathway ATPase VirB11/archaellum biosynthesis ATPase